MLRALGVLPEYESLLRRMSARYELALRARGETLVEHDLIAFIGAPGVTVPVHFDRNHHLLVQVRGSKVVGTGTFSDPATRQRQIERGMQPRRFNADLMPDRSEEHVLRAGEALVIPAFTFHWVQGRDDVSIAMTCVVASTTTARDSAVHEFNLRSRKLGLHPAPPGRNARVDRMKEKVFGASTKLKKKIRRR
jgi:hypothetical protein